MKIAIIAAMEPEIAYYLAHLPVKREVTTAQVEWWEVEWGEHQLFFARSGIGKVNAAIATTVLAMEKPDLIINSGSAGAVTFERQIGDVVVSEGAMYHDVDATAFGYEMGQVPQMPAIYPTDEKISQQFMQFYAKKVKKVVGGLILTSDSFIADTNKVKDLEKQFSKAQCTEMEGAAIAQVAYQFQIPCVIVRAISDTASQDANILFDEFIEKAGRESAELTLAFIKEKLLT